MEKLNAPPPNSIDAGKKYSVTVHTSRGDFVIDLVDPKIAPQTVNNFVYLAQNPYKWPRGTVGMASSAAGVSGSQFFITIGDAPFLATNGVYNRFGQVSSGMDVIDKIKVGDTMRSLDVSTS